MASVGLLGQHFIKFPGFEKAPSGFKALGSGEGVLGFTLILVVSGVLELAWRDNKDKEPGNFGDPFGVKMYTEEMRNKEINNGRFAMICVFGIFAAEMATGKDAIQQFGLAAVGSGSAARSGVASAFTGFSASAIAPRSLTQRRAVDEEAPAPPPFAPSAQVGAVAPLGFFDQLGFTQVGDEDGFRKLRASEIKHGRVAMMASVGLLGQHFIKFPGFEKAPACFKAMYSGEGVLGFTLILVLSGVQELAWRDNKDREPGNFKDPFGVKMYNEEMRNKEIS